MSLLKVNEVQNYNGSSLTLTASTVSTSAQLNTGGNISVTGSINVSDDSTTRSNLGLGSIATQDSDNVTVTGGTATLGALTVSGSDSGDLVRITQTGSGNALVVEDDTNPDSTPFVVDSSGYVGIGTSSPSRKLDVESGEIVVATLVSTNAGNYSLLRFLDAANTNESVAAGIGSIGTALSFQTNGNPRMRIDSSGNVGIGTTAPTSTLHVNGSVSKSSGSFRIDHPIKPETHDLVHSFVEAPQADLIYRGKVDLVDGSATVNIDTAAGMTEGTFELLNREVQCFTSNESGWTNVRGSVSGNILTIEAEDNNSSDTISWLVIGERQDQHMYDTEWTNENGKVIVEPLKEIEALETA